MVIELRWIIKLFCKDITVFENMPQTIYKYSGKSDIGPERNVNQDSFRIAELDWGSLFLVSDGFGHEKGGLFASRSSVDIFIDEFLEEPPKDIKKFLLNTFRKINKHIYYHKVSEFNKAMLGCTTVAMIFQNNLAHIAHVGDSRGYLIRKNSLIQLTKDHSYIQTLIDKGKVAPEEALLNPKRHVLSKALGSRKNPTPGYKSIEIESDDKFILCSDGVWGYMSDDVILNIINKNVVSTAVTKVIDHIKKSDGLDNITLQVIHFK